MKRKDGGEGQVGRTGRRGMDREVRKRGIKEREGREG